MMQAGVESKCGGKRLQGISAEGTADQPLVTVITAVFNGQPYIADCLESVLTQDYSNIEHIVLDAGSTDGTIELLHQYSDKVALWISEPDRGVYDAWNKGLREARGEWITFLGADDIYLPGAISTYLELARTNPAAEFLSSRARLNHPTGYSPVFGGPWEWPAFCASMSTVHVGTMHHRQLFHRLGEFDTTYQIAGDYEFMLRAHDTLRTAFSPAITVEMRAGGISDSTAGLHEAKRAKLGNGVRGVLAAELELRRAIVRFHVRRLYLKLRAAYHLIGGMKI